MFNKLTISKKIGLGFAVISALIALTVFTTYWKVKEVKKVSLQIAEQEVPIFTQGMKLLNGLNETLAIVRGYVLVKNPRLSKRREEIWENDIKEPLAKIQAISIENPNSIAADTLKTINEQLQELNEFQDQILNISHTSKNTPAIDLIRVKGTRYSQEIFNKLSEMINEEGMRKTNSGKHKEIFWLIADSRGFFSISLFALTEYLHFADPERKAEFQTQINKSEQALSQLNRMHNYLNQKQITALKSTLLSFNELKEMATKAIQIRESDKWNLANHILKSKAVPAATKLRTTIEKIVINTENKIKIDSKKDKEIIESLGSLLWLIFAFSILVSTVLGTFLTKDITKTLSTEINSLRSASDQLRKASSDQLNSVTEQTAVTSQVSSTMKELNEMAKSVLKRCRDMASFADSAVDITADGRQAVHGAQTIMSEIKEQIEIIVKLMLNLGEKSQKIDVALKIIRELSEQTTILSYNAAIEAAAAGEAGQSFAVVANQVGKLAQRAKEASRDVKILIEEIQQSTNTTVMATEDALKAADRGRKIQNHASEKMNSVEIEIKRTLEAAREIEMASNQQSTSSEQVREGVDNIMTTASQTQANSKNVLETAKRIVSSAENLERI